MTEVEDLESVINEMKNQSFVNKKIKFIYVVLVKEV